MATATPIAPRLRQVTAVALRRHVPSGAATAEQLRSNLRAAEVPWTVESEVRLQSLTMASTEYWRERSALPRN